MTKIAIFTGNIEQIVKDNIKSLLSLHEVETILCKEIEHNKIYLRVETNIQNLNDFYFVCEIKLENLLKTIEIQKSIKLILNQMKEESYEPSRPVL